MAETSARTPYLGRYTGILVAAIVAVLVINFIMIRLAGFSVPSGAAAILPPMVAALMVGQAWGRDAGTVPQNARAWRFAVVGGLIYAAIQIGITMLGLASQGGRVDIAELLPILAGVLMITTIIVIVINRLFVSIGAKGVVARK